MLDKVPMVAPQTAPVVYHPHPFSSENRPMTMSAGMTLLEMVNALGIRPEFRAMIRVWVDDVEIPREAWAFTRPRAGRYVYIKTTPQGGGGGGGKNILASVLMLLVVVGAAIFAPMIAGVGGLGLTGTALQIGTSLIGAGLTMLGALAINALIPPPSKSDGLVGQMALLSGVRNQMKPYADIPRIFGKRRVYPLLAARPYTEASGKNRYLRVLLCVGWGPLRITNIKIGDTPIGAFASITHEIREGWTSDEFGALPAGKTADTPQTLFTKQVLEDNFNVVLDGGSGPGAWVTRRTETDVSEISVDIAFPTGLVRYDDDGDRKTTTVVVEVQWRKVGDTTWTSVVWDGNDTDDGTQTNGSLTGTDNSATPVYRGGRWIVPETAQYDVRMRRQTANNGGQYADRTEWIVLRSIRYQNPVNLNGLALIALRLKATDQLNGLPDTINCIAESYLPTWSGSSWTYALTRNPAWAYADIMRRRGAERVLADSRIDLPTIRSWALDANTTAVNAAENRWLFDGIFEGGSIMTALQQIGAHGRAAFTMRDGKYSVVRDIAQTVPVQVITPRNSWGYSGSKAFLDLPHALRVSYIDAENGYQDDEIIVYADSYSKVNATRFERLDLPACTSATMAWREGRYHLAVGRLRPEEHVVNMDIEALRCNAGDLVYLAHDVLSIGLSSGRITARIVNGSGQVTGYVLDETIQLDPSVTYALRTRRSPGGIALEPLASVSVSTVTNEVTLATPVAAGSAADDGDLFVFGEADRVTAPMLVKKIEPGGDLTARLTLVDAQQGIYTADTGEIPPFETYASTQTPYEQQLPPAPSFTLQSDETMVERQADGTLVDRIGVIIRPFPSADVEVAGVAVEYREYQSAGWIGAATVDADTRVVHIAGVKQGTQYEVRARSVARAGAASLWVVSAPHIVIGKTTVPRNVTGLTASGRVDGVQLTWALNTEIDVVGYEVRRGTTWGSATVVARLTDGPSLFVAVNVAQSQTFLIRAVDALGLKSVAAADATAAVVPPANIARFDAYPQGENIRFVWSQVSGQGVAYEIRCGDEWATAQRVARVTGDTVTLAWPVTSSDTVRFWIKAVSLAGLFSGTGRFVNLPRTPTQGRNVVLTEDFGTANWSDPDNAITDMELVAAGPSVFLLQSALDGAGLTRPRGELCRIAPLVDIASTRSWIDLAAAGSAASVTWADAAFSWDGSAGMTWLGGAVSDEDVSVTASIALSGAGLPVNTVEAWRFDGSTTGANGTALAQAIAAVYATCRFSRGLDVSGYPSAANGPQYALSVPSAFSAVFDVKLKSDYAAGTSYVLAQLNNGVSNFALGAGDPTNATYWQSGATTSGVTATRVDTGIDAVTGEAWAEYDLSGTMTAASSSFGYISVAGSQTAGLNNETWTASARLSVVSGSVGSGAAVAIFDGTTFSSSPVTSATPAIASVTRKLVANTNVRCFLRIIGSSGTVVSGRVRIQGLQFEKAATRGGSDSWLRLIHDASSGKFRLQGSSGAALEIDAGAAAGELLTFGISQSATDRALFLKRYRSDDVEAASAAIAPVGGFARLSFYDTVGAGDVWLPSAKAVLGDTLILSVPQTEADFTDFVTDPAPTGFSPWREFVPGEYNVERAAIRIQCDVANPAVRATIVSAVLNMDVPDTVERRSIAVAAGGTTVTFEKMFNAVPTVVAVQSGGATVAIVKTESVTTTGFTVKLHQATSPATTVAGQIDFTATGY